MCFKEHFILLHLSSMGEPVLDMSQLRVPVWAPEKRVARASESFSLSLWAFYSWGIEIIIPLRLFEELNEIIANVIFCSYFSSLRNTSRERKLRFLIFKVSFSSYHAWHHVSPANWSKTGLLQNCKQEAGIAHFWMFSMMINWLPKLGMCRLKLVLQTSMLETKQDMEGLPWLVLNTFLLKFSHCKNLKKKKKFCHQPTKLADLKVFKKIYFFKPKARTHCLEW